MSSPRSSSPKKKPSSSIERERDRRVNWENIETKGVGIFFDAVGKEHKPDPMDIDDPMDVDQNPESVSLRR